MDSLSVVFNIVFSLFLANMAFSLITMIALRSITPVRVRSKIWLSLLYVGQIALAYQTWSRSVDGSFQPCEGPYFFTQIIAPNQNIILLFICVESWVCYDNYHSRKAPERALLEDNSNDSRERSGSSSTSASSGSFQDDDKILINKKRKILMGYGAFHLIRAVVGFIGLFGPVSRDNRCDSSVSNYFGTFVGVITIIAIVILIKVLWNVRDVYGIKKQLKGILFVALGLGIPGFVVASFGKHPHVTNIGYLIVLISILAMSIIMFGAVAVDAIIQYMEAKGKKKKSYGSNVEAFVKYCSANMITILGRDSGEKWIKDLYSVFLEGDVVNNINFSVEAKMINKFFWDRIDVEKGKEVTDYDNKGEAITMTLNSCLMHTSVKIQKLYLNRLGGRRTSITLSNDITGKYEKELKKLEELNTKIDLTKDAIIEALDVVNAISTEIDEWLRVNVFIKLAQSPLYESFAEGISLLGK